MADTIFTRALTAASEIQGGTQALAGLLRVPEGTLLRWLSGSAMMPLRAFIKVIDLLAEHERCLPDERSAHAAEPPTLTFGLNNSSARCASCSGTEFVERTPGARLRYSGTLACRSCGKEVVHRSLLVDLAMFYARQHGQYRQRARAERPRAGATP